MKKLIGLLLLVLLLTACTEKETVETVTEKAYQALAKSNVLHMSGNVSISLDFETKKEYDFEKIIQKEPFVYYERHDTIPYPNEFYITNTTWFKMDKKVGGFIHDTRRNAEKEISYISNVSQAILAEAKSIKKLAEFKQYATLVELPSSQYKLEFSSTDSEVLAKYVEGNSITELFKELAEYKITHLDETIVVNKETFQVTNRVISLTLTGKRNESDQPVKMDIIVNMLDVTYEIDNELVVPTEVITEANENTIN
ncbi:hypothetical protein CIB95_11390 [Lottiidibacillus patelloidae]|uniref:Uncharacterized protein n=1 Tax=Lottiidibacillus patelloidae TaxID=2670334 RepID=A0A263BS20_9BACI|nr:DUF6612 family protein [Lottiidibacillus patelloidae]OZM56372.1 hypothetical protein CIB95_11390 [Lottiidibacillus patelloidae]